MSAEELRAQINQATGLPVAADEREIAELRAYVATLERALSGADAEVEGVRESLAERESRVVDLEGTLAMRDRELGELRRHQEIRAALLRRRGAQVAELRRVLDQRDAELASAWVELDRLRAERDAAYEAAARPVAQAHWVVARDDGRWCERCEAEVRRGEAYEEQPGTGGLVVHIRCPDMPTDHARRGEQA